MHIEVTQEDIDRGERGKSRSCAVARAIRRCAKCRSADVCSSWLRLRWRKVLTPVVVARFIKAYDLGLPVDPFAFDLPD